MSAPPATLEPGTLATATLPNTFRTGVRGAERQGIQVIAVAVGIAALPLLLPLGGGTAAVDIVLLASVAVTFVWLGSSGTPAHLPYAGAVALIVTGGAIGAFRSPVPALSDLTLVEDVYLLVWAMVVANVVRTPGALRTVLRTWCVSAPLWAFALILYVAKSGTGVLNTTSGSRASFAFGDDNGLALYFVIALMVIWATRTPRNPLLRAAAIGVLLIAIALTGSLAGILGLLAGVCTVLTVSIAVRRDVVTATSFVLVSLMLFGTLWLNAGSIASWAQASRYAVIRNSLGREVASRSGRQLLTTEATQLYANQGPFGLGPASTKEWLAADQAPYVKEAHDDWTAAIVERGVIGLIGVGVLFVAFTWRALRIADPKRLSEGFRRVIPVPAGLLGAVVTIGVYSITHEVLHDRTAWAIMGLVAGLFLWGRRDAEAERW